MLQKQVSQAYNVKEKNYEKKEDKWRYGKNKSRNKLRSEHRSKTANACQTYNWIKFDLGTCILGESHTEKLFKK
jgi:hypothetical protein